MSNQEQPKNREMSDIQLEFQRSMYESRAPAISNRGIQ